MKKRDLERLLRKNGWVKEEGTKHDRWTKSGQTEFIPRHTEINELLAKAIIKRRRLK